MISLFIEPLDVLALRGNKLFGDAGSYGESLVPPWPSVAAGAIRSMILAREGAVSQFANGQASPELGTPAEPGPFTITAFHLARRREGRIEPLFAPPADVVVDSSANGWVARRMRPNALASGLSTSSKSCSLPVLGQPHRRKPLPGLWLTAAGWRSYLADRAIAVDEMVGSRELWEYDLRVGIGLSPATRHVEEGKLFSANTVAFKRDNGFLVRISGVAVPPQGMLRFGGDGRGAYAQLVEPEWPEPDFESIARAGRARLVLTTPGLFEQGWLPTGSVQAQDGTYCFNLHGVQGRLVCAAVPRPETISGFDLVKRAPKTALRAAPSGSVYWLDQLEATPKSLRKLAEIGLWPEPGYKDPRRAEGFNRTTVAAYSAEGTLHV